MVSQTKFVIVVASLLLIVSAAAYSQRAMSVTVQKAEIRSAPSFMGRVLTTLEYGDSVRVRREQGSWYEVAIPDSRDRGWIHESALTKKRILFAASTTEMSTEATSSEVALAGKGFNKQVESQFIEETAYDYTWVDRVEQMVVPIEEIRAFMEAGGLSVNEGDRR